MTKVHNLAIRLNISESEAYFYAWITEGPWAFILGITAF